MAYYVKAVRNGKAIKLPVEDKHKYLLGVVNAGYDNGTYYSNPIVRLYKCVDDPTINPGNNANISANSVGLCINNQDQLILLSAGNTFCLDKQGPDGLNEFIGDKIYLKSVTYTITITPLMAFMKFYTKTLHDSNIYSQVSYAVGTDHINQITTPVFNLAPPKPIRINLRLMLIKFSSALNGDTETGLLSDMDDGLVNTHVNQVKTELAKWFNESRIYMESSNNYQVDANGDFDEDAHLNQCIQPLYTDRLRDSCKWSGKFKVLWDQKIEFTGKALHFDKTFQINKNCNMEEVEIINSQGGSTNKFKITGNTLKNTYLVLFGPGCNNVDICEPVLAYVNGMYDNYQNALRVFCNTKYTYYDI